jgi:hypothetical protein
MKILLPFVLALSAVMAIPSYAQQDDEEVAYRVKQIINSEVNCLAQNIYYEAGSEPYEGKLAVAQVTLNRTRSPKYPKTICEVVHQRTTYNGKTVCQFTWTCEKSYPIRSKYNWEECVIIAKRALTEAVLHDTIHRRNALYYHANYVDPKWSQGRVIMRIGNHIFYT